MGTFLGDKGAEAAPPLVHLGRLPEGSMISAVVWMSGEKQFGKLLRNDESDKKDRRQYKDRSGRTEYTFFKNGSKM